MKPEQPQPKTQLEVGDLIYSETQYNLSLYEIRRVTPTTAILKDGTRFRRQLKPDGFLQEIGRDKWSDSFCIETPRLKAMYERNIKFGDAKGVIKALNLEKMTTEKLDELIQALTPFLPKDK